MNNLAGKLDIAGSEGSNMASRVWKEGFKYVVEISLRNEHDNDFIF